jgi:type I restriction enzyme S subunit
VTSALRSLWRGAGGGRLPEGWNLAAVADVLSDDRGLSVGVMYPGIHDPAGVPLIKVGDVSSGTINRNPDFRISLSVHHEYRRTALEGGELLITLVGRPGLCLEVTREMRGWNAARALAVVRLSPRVDTRFFRYAFGSPPIHHLVDGFCNTTVQATLNLKEIRALPIPLPPLAEQRRIAAILGAQDDKIELNRKMNRTLEEMAQALFKSWFIDFDGHDDLVDSEIGPVPRGWGVRSLDAIADFLNGAACQKYPATDGEPRLPVIKIRELNQGVTTETDRATSTIPAKWHVKDGDVLFSWSGSLVVKVWTGGPGALNQHLFKVTSKEYPRWFFLSWVRHHLAEFQRIAADKATTMGHIQRHHLTAAKCAVPPPDVLRRVGALLEPVVNRQIANELESRTLIALRDTLLPKLISGEMRVSDALLPKLISGELRVPGTPVEPQGEHR